MADERQVITLRNRLAEVSDQLTTFKKKTLARIRDATDPIGMGASDLAGGSLALGAKAGIEVITDKVRKIVTPLGQPRAPSVVSGAVAWGLGTAVYIGNLALGLDIPLPWYREIPKSMAFGLSLLGTKELGQVAVIWNEQRQLKTQAAIAQAALLQAQQQAALANANAGPAKV